MARSRDPTKDSILSSTRQSKPTDAIITANPCLAGGACYDGVKSVYKGGLKLRDADHRKRAFVQLD
ncbi:MAG TPA: hypothetical protein VIX19_08205 [Terriglobales bacterium]